MRIQVLLMVALAAWVTSTGCLPRTFVRKNPGPNDRGIRYYRPKPYLMLTPLIVDKQVEPDMVELSIEYLPDYEEEYSIHIRSGLGINDTSVTLDQGWNLTHISVKADSQTDENIKAVGELLGNVARLAGGGGERAMAVKATNVPMGLYEAVISPDSCGIKRLYGFRYVGFFPFASCPLESCGVENRPCGSGEIYGLVWEGGAMVFRLMDELPQHVNLKEAEIAHNAALPPLDLETGEAPASVVRLDGR